MYSNNSIHNWDTKKKHISKSLGISINTLKKYVKILEENKLAWIEGNILRLGSKRKWNDFFNTKPTKDRFKVLTLKIHQLNIINLKFEALKIKRSQIEWKQKEKVGKVLLKGYRKINCSNTEKKIKSFLKVKVEGVYEKYSENVSYNFVQKTRKYGFLDNNMSGKSISKLFGRKSSITGNRFLRTLYLSNVIEVEQRKLLLVEIEGQNPKFSEGNLFLSEGSMCRMLPLRWVPNGTVYYNNKI